MRAYFKVFAITVFLGIPVFAQNTTPSRLDQATIVRFSEKTAIAALNFQQGDAVGFARAHDDFTSDGWKDFTKRMEGFLDRRHRPPESRATNSCGPLLRRAPSRGSKGPASGSPSDSPIER
jgi:hypothetical protein